LGGYFIRYIVRFCRGGFLRFLSQNETKSAFEKLLRRNKLPLTYTEGYNPHPKISYSDAMKTGVASSGFYALINTDYEVEEINENFKNDISGLKVLRFWKLYQNNKLDDYINGYEFRIFLNYKNFDCSLYDENKMISKKTKRKTTEIHAGEVFRNISFKKLNKYFMVEYDMLRGNMVSYESIIELLSKRDVTEYKDVYVYVQDAILDDEKTSNILNDKLGGSVNVRS